ncbi:hypothetical protein [Rhodanobacter sp. OK091]|uniref:hypothetical protein n=1 Tax=Rhodanobacter sp. OK091 TaxID=1881037 RepID=UPI00091C0F69|nr:hypothetical protein [Rhodanobacter sp. OK091]SHL63299.1 hypothetical protein SAMN05428972_0444 [Rhodanobacter sp. OK091]
MATRKEDGIEAIATMHQGMESPKLTFAALDARIEALPESPSDTAVFPKKAKWGLVAAAAGALFGLLSVKLLPSNAMYTLVLAYAGLAVEIAGAAIMAISQIPKKWPTFANERRDFAKQLDFDLPHHLALVEWLQTFPLDQRERLSEFVSYRHERMKERLPMLTGSIEKLGALPIVIALYLQFKDMHWPPHPSWVEIFLIFVLALGYWLSVMQISIRLRLQLYETLLSKALT